MQAAYDEENEALPAKYTVLKIFEVIPPGESSKQMGLDELPDMTAPEGDNHGDRGPFLLPPPPPDKAE